MKVPFDTSQRVICNVNEMVDIGYAPVSHILRPQPGVLTVGAHQAQQIIEEKGAR